MRFCLCHVALRSFSAVGSFLLVTWCFGIRLGLVHSIDFFSRLPSCWSDSLYLMSCSGFQLHYTVLKACCYILELLHLCSNGSIFSYLLSSGSLNFCVDVIFESLSPNNVLQTSSGRRPRSDVTRPPGFLSALFVLCLFPLSEVCALAAQAQPVPPAPLAFPKLRSCASSFDVCAFFLC